MTAEEVAEAMDLYIGTYRAFGAESDEAAERGEQYRAAVRELGDADAA